MNKITRLNWFKKVFGGVAALCAWPMLAKASNENPYLTAEEKLALQRAYTLLPKYRTVQLNPTIGTDIGGSEPLSTVRPFLNIFRDNSEPSIRTQVPIWLGQIPENISEFGLMERMIYGVPLTNQTLLNWGELETQTFARCTTYKANMIGLVALRSSGQLPKGCGGEVVLYEIRQFGQRWAGVYADSEGAARDFGVQFMNYIKLLGVPSRTK